jgi:hypothetical protein
LKFKISGRFFFPHLPPFQDITLVPMNNKNITWTASTNFGLIWSE